MGAVERDLWLLPEIDRLLVHSPAFIFFFESAFFFFRINPELSTLKHYQLILS
jgi:hypothetical protein